jgi:hypothetical protein
MTSALFELDGALSIWPSRIMWWMRVGSPGRKVNAPQSSCRVV